MSRHRKPVPRRSYRGLVAAAAVIVLVAVPVGIAQAASSGPSIDDLRARAHALTAEAAALSADLDAWTPDTVSVPGPTTTLTPAPGPTVTVTEAPAPGPTVTVTATPAPTVTASPTPTVVASPSPTPTPSPTTTVATGCARLPSSCGFPDATNTGVPAGTVLKRVPQDVTKGVGWEWDGKRIQVSNNAVLDGLQIGADLSILDATNVLVKNCLIIAGTDTFGIALRHSTNVTIQDTSVTSSKGSDRSLTLITDVYRDSVNTKILRVNLTGSSGSVSMDAGLLQDSYLHDLGYRAGDHTNGFTSNSTSGQLTIRHNTVLNSFTQTDAISLFQDFGPQNNRLIENNLVAGGAYAIYGGSDGSSGSSNVIIRNNVFSRIYFANCGQYGPIAHFNAGSNGNVWSGNVWDVTGLPVANS